MKKMKGFWESLEEETTISKRELFLSIACCALAGIVFGVFFSPKKTTVIGCNNGNGGTGSNLKIEDEEE